jgi:hypothetical protein
VTHQRHPLAVGARGKNARDDLLGICSGAVSGRSAGSMASAPEKPTDTATSSAVSTARTSGLEMITSSLTPWRANDAPTSSAARRPSAASGRSPSSA